MASRNEETFNKASTSLGMDRLIEDIDILLNSPTESQIEALSKEP